MNRNEQIFQRYMNLPEYLQDSVALYVEFVFQQYLQGKSQNVSKPSGKRGGFGTAKGLIVMSADFDEPLDDFKDYM